MGGISFQYHVGVKDLQGLPRRIYLAHLIFHCRLKFTNLVKLLVNFLFLLVRNANNFCSVEEIIPKIDCLLKIEQIYI